MRVHACTHAGPLTPAQLRADGSSRGSERPQRSSYIRAVIPRPLTRRTTIFPSSHRLLMLASSRLPGLGPQPASSRTSVPTRGGSACQLLSVPLPVVTASAQPAKAQLRVFSVETHSASRPLPPRVTRHLPGRGAEPTAPVPQRGRPHEAPQMHFATSGGKRNCIQASFPQVASSYGEALRGTVPEGTGGI